MRSNACMLVWFLMFAGGVAYLEAGVGRLAARTDLADPALLHQLAVGVVVGYPGGDSSAAGLGALGPGCGLHDALLELRSECCKTNKAPFRTLFACEELKQVQCIFELTRQGLESGLHDGDELVLVGEVALGVVDRRIVAKLLVQLPVVADPLLAALARHFDQPGVGAAQRGQGELLRAQRNAAHRPVDASALVLAVGLEALSVLVDPAVVLTRSALRFSCERKPTVYFENSSLFFSLPPLIIHTCFPFGVFHKA